MKIKEGDHVRIISNTTSPSITEMTNLIGHVGVFTGSKVNGAGAWHWNTRDLELINKSEDYTII